MIVVLTIKEESKIPWYKRLFIRKSNDVTAVIKEYEEIKVLNIQAKKRGKKINFKKISKLIPKGKYIIYDGETDIPEEYKILVARPILYKLCMLRNTYRYILKNLKIDPNLLKVGLYDPNGDYINLVQEIIPFVRQINIVTNNQEKYSIEANYIMDEFGAALLISNSVEWLSNNHIIIAPDKIKKDMPSSTNSIILTTQKPAVNLRGLVYYDYRVKPPLVYQKLKPEGISNELFIGALYDEYQPSDLEQLVPYELESCLGNYDIEKIVCYLKNICR